MRPRRQIVSPRAAAAATAAAAAAAVGGAALPAHRRGAPDVGIQRVANVGLHRSGCSRIGRPFRPLSAFPRYGVSEPLVVHPLPGHRVWRQKASEPPSRRLRWAATTPKAARNLPQRIHVACANRRCRGARPARAGSSSWTNILKLRYYLHHAPNVSQMAAPWLRESRIQTCSSGRNLREFPDMLGLAGD